MHVVVEINGVYNVFPEGTPVTRRRTATFGAIYEVSVIIMLIWLVVCGEFNVVYSTVYILCIVVF